MELLEHYLNLVLIRVSGYEVTVGQLLLIPTVLLFGYLLVGWVGRAAVGAMTRRGVNADIVQLVRRAIFILGMIILFITMLDLINVPLTAFAFVSGAVAIGVGFGAQNIVNNFISGWILIWERPIRINDFIELGDVFGTVEQINTRSTRIRRVDGVHLLVPNSKLLEETVVNWTLRDQLLRCLVRVGVCYGSPVEKVRDLLYQAVKEHPLTLDEPPIQIIFEDFGDNALIFEAFFWVNVLAEKNARVVRSDIRFEINRLLTDAGIVIAFPQRDVHVDGSIEIRQPGQ
ncbi:MAG: mechanosensitive ion channel [Proteobacteria bacterium]|nr:mechanosensitive ion channel [Pseudomonadota bacterium]